MVDLLELPLLRAKHTKNRYNISLYPDDVKRMDNVAHELHVSRSELLTYCFNLFYTEYRGFGDAS